MMNATKMKIEHISIQVAQKGILVSGVLSIPTQRQSTNEQHKLDAGYGTKSIIKALWLFRRDAIRYAKQQQAEPGNYPIEPSNFRRCLLWT